jgi:hypothetical protein
MKRQRIFALLVVLVLSLSIAPLEIPKAKAAGGLNLDGTAEGSAGNLTVGSTTCATSTTTLTTINKPDVIVALLVTNDTHAKVGSVSDTQLLKWKFRANKTAAEPFGTGYAQTFEYFAISSGRLSGDIVTFTISTAEAAICTAFGVSGANTLSPFESNSLLPYENRDYTSVGTLTYTTKNPNDFLIYFMGYCAFSVGEGTPTGFTSISSRSSQTSNCPADFLRSGSFYEKVSNIQSANVVPMTLGPGPSPWGAIGDAIQSTPYVSSISPVHGPSGSSIAITGTSFNGTTSVDFCGAAATFTVVSDTSITANLPNCSAGSNLDVTVTNTLGASPTSPSDLFYVDPSPPLTVSVVASSNALDVGQLASFSCVVVGGVSAYSYSWTFGDGSTGSGASTSHIYSTPGTMTVVCTATDTLGTMAKDSTKVSVGTDPSITAFAASPASLSAGEKITFVVVTSGGDGPLSYSYENLPAGCLSTNSASLSCYPTSSGNYRVTVTVTERGGESATGTVSITVGPQRVLGLPQATGLAVIFGAVVGIGALVILSIILAVRRRRRRQGLATT